MNFKVQHWVGWQIEVAKLLIAKEHFTFVLEAHGIWVDATLFVH